MVISAYRPYNIIYECVYSVEACIYIFKSVCDYDEGAGGTE